MELNGSVLKNNEDYSLGSGFVLSAVI